ncbi:hypothetical protein ASE12_14270 [Aeromicrobium sp. Root236]|nr:hypothetical protein ASE12_14270 [Aeromicrobium sp. Root236]
MHVAVVGGGPSGCYTAAALRKVLPGVQISVFDSRPAPFGLIRYGVAPDHQGMKNVARQFERLFASGGTEFFGGVTVGADLSLEELTDNYHVVVMATGLAQDRPLGIPVDPYAALFGAGEVMRYLNSDPDERLRAWSDDPSRRLGQDVLIIGAGNVALDVARLLAKTDEELIGSDIDDTARASLEIPRIESIRILGRGPREKARWDAVMLTELCALPSTEVWIDGERVTASDQETPTTIEIEFTRTPLRVDHVDERSVLVAADSAGSGAEHVYVVDSIVTATGFVAADPQGPHTSFDGSLPVVRIGGCSSGVLGNLAENRALAKAAAAEVVTLVDQKTRRAGADGIRPLMDAAVLSYDDWLAVDAEEVRRAGPGRCRQKISSLPEMHVVVDAHRRAAHSRAGSDATRQQLSL